MTTPGSAGPVPSDGTGTGPDARVKPRLRGVSHQYGFFVSVVLGAALVATAGSPRSALGALVFALSLSGLLGTSALYHRVDWTPSKRALMRRLDHSMIFVLIAGTFTPIAMISLTADLGARWLWISWSLAGFGAVLRVVWLTAPKWLTAVLAVALGWISLTVLPEVLDSIGWLPVLFVALGGLSYTVGAAIYSFKRPDPMPAVFGYHEIFHALVLIGAGFHYAMIAIWII